MEVERRSSGLLDTAIPSFLATVSNSSTPKTVSQNDAVQSSPVQSSPVPAGEILFGMNYKSSNKAG
jgi:hypothetical protein